MFKEVFSLLFFYATGLPICVVFARFPCPKWLYAASKLNNPWARAALAKSVVEFAAISEGMTVLNIGCGHSGMEKPLSSRVGDEGCVLGVDGVDGLPWHAGESYDCAILVTALGEMHDREKSLENVYSLLKPGGKLIILESLIDPHFHSMELAKDLATRAGFVEENAAGNLLTYSLSFAKNVENAA